MYAILIRSWFNGTYIFVWSLILYACKLSFSTGTLRNQILFFCVYLCVVVWMHVGWWKKARAVRHNPGVFYVCRYHRGVKDAKGKKKKTVWEKDGMWNWCIRCCFFSCHDLSTAKKIHECMIFSSCVCNEKEVADRGLETAVLRGSHAYNKRKEQ